MRYSAEYNINDMNDSIGSSIVHLYNVAPRCLALDGNVRSSKLLDDTDLLPRSGHHGVGAGVEGGGQDQSRSHVAEQSGLQDIRLGEKYLR